MNQTLHGHRQRRESQQLLEGTYADGLGSSLGDFAAFPMAMTRPEASRGTPFSSVSLTA